MMFTKEQELLDKEFEVLKKRVAVLESLHATKELELVEGDFKKITGQEYDEIKACLARVMSIIGMVGGR